jgi:hypothetical protein
MLGNGRGGKFDNVASGYLLGDKQRTKTQEGWNRTENPAAHVETDPSQRGQVAEAPATLTFLKIVLPALYEAALLRARVVSSLQVMTRAMVMALTFGISAFAQSVIGTVSGFRAESGEIQVQRDNGEAIFVKLGPDTLAQRVAPGERDLKKAESIRVTDLAVGDRVLVSFVPGLGEARRIVVMSANDIARRQEAERRDWVRRGLFGVVEAVKQDRVTLRSGTVMVNDKTVFRRYAPDSVRFSDAVPSSLAEIRKGDQLGARGEKSPDGRSVAAEEVVFGTFVTKAASVTAVQVEAGAVEAKDLETNKPLTIKLTPDSQIKRMTGPLGPADLSEMLERLPAATLAELKPGEAIVVSSTRGASSNQLTAITLVANAERLIQMATMQSRASRPQGPSLGPELGLSGLELPGMMP